MAYDKIGYTINAKSLKSWIDNTATTSERARWQTVLSDIYGVSDFTSLADSNGNVDIGEMIGLSNVIGDSSYIYSFYLTDMNRAFKGTYLYSFNSNFNYDATANEDDKRFYIRTFGNTATSISFPYQLNMTNKIMGISKGGEFAGTYLTTLDAPENAKLSPSNLLDYTKYKITRSAEYIYIYRYRVTREKDMSSAYLGNPAWTYLDSGYANYASNAHPFKLVEGNWSDGGSLLESYSKTFFPDSVIPMQFILAVSGAGGSGGYNTVWSSTGAGGSAGAFAIIYLDWSKVPVDSYGNRSVWVRIPHRSNPTSNNNWQNFYNLSTALSSHGDICVDPYLCATQTQPVVYDCYNSTRCCFVSSGVNAGGTNLVTKSSYIINSSDIKTTTYGRGINESAFTVIASAYGGVGAQRNSTDAKSAENLIDHYNNINTNCSTAYLSSRVRGSVTEKSHFLTQSYAATPNAAAGGSSWFASGAAGNKSALLSSYGAGGGGRYASAGEGFMGGSGCVKIYY